MFCRSKKLSHVTTHHCQADNQIRSFCLVEFEKYATDLKQKFVQHIQLINE